MRLFEGTEFYQAPRCERCSELEEECQCPPRIPEPEPPKNQTARIQVEKRKRGKLVTVVRGLFDGTPEPHFSELLSRLKNACGAGGSLQNETIEIQGDHADRIVKILAETGYRIRVQ